MKILLTAINAKYIHSNPAVYDLRSYAGEFSEYIEIAEYTINNRASVCLADIYKRKPDVIAFSCYIWNWDFIKRMLPDLNKIMPDTHIWLGGPESSFHVQDTIDALPFIKGIMIGEGEKIFKDLVSAYVENTDLSQVKGICINDNGKALYTAEAEPLDMDDIPFIYKDLSDFKNRIVYYESSRGCPYRCSYCLSAIDKKLRFRSLDKVKEELTFFINNQVPQVKFIDRTFNCNHERTKEIWKFITENDNGITNFHFEIAADIITDEEIALLSKMRPGLVQLEIGVQSTNFETIKEINRVMDIDKLKKVVADIKKPQNVHVHLDLIAGLPYEDLESFRSSFNDVYNMAPDQLQLGFLKVLKGSIIEEKASEYGIVYSSEPPYEVLKTNWISFDDLMLLKGIEEMVETYYNSGQFVFSMKALAEYFKDPFKLYESLYKFYEENGYTVNTPSRLEKYMCLYKFIASLDVDDMEKYKEVLNFDAYLRENCKKRPEFSRDLNEYRKLIFEKEKEAQDILPKKNRNNVHIDVFYYPVHELSSKKVEEINAFAEPIVIGFDYENRSPIDNNARVVVL